MAPKVKTFLQLPPEMGGLRFGPFDAWIQIGSDAKQNQLVLAAGHGIYPSHVTVGLLDDGTYTIAPASRECKVFIMPQGQAQVWPVAGPVQARSGDLLILGTPSGPRFQIQQEGPAAAPPSAREIVRTARATGGERGFVQGASQWMEGLFRPSGSGLSGEVRRRAQAKALSTPGPLRTLYQLSTRFRSGAFNNPYYIVAVLASIVGLIGTGSVSCTGIMYAVWTSLGLEW